MIDEVKAREKVDTMNKRNLQNLLTALAVEKYLFDIFGSSVITGYSPETQTMLVKYMDSRPNALKNILECVKRATHQNPTSHPYEVVEGTLQTRDRLTFPSGFSVMAIHETGAKSCL
ncbi:MAG: hypothetical protein IMZ54_11755 [Acidobacteria bacterium]|nr:hypothetical protein [Acidobacteriota bacterium]